MSVLFTRRGPAPQGKPSAADLEVGSSVFLNVGGVPKEFLIVHQGKPSSIYDDSCDGTWLLMKDCWEKRVWHSSNSNSYKASTIHTYLNGTFLNLFDAEIITHIKTVKIPYVNGTGTTGSIASGSSGLSAQIFLPSCREVGITAAGSASDTPYLPVDGACWSYFDGTTTHDSKRSAYLDGTAINWWLRSAYTNNDLSAWKLNNMGSPGTGQCSSNSYGIRPALILPSNSLFDPTTKEFIGVGGNSSGSSGSQTNTYTITFSEMENSGTSNTCSITADGTTHTMSTDLVLKVNPGTVITVSSTDSNFTYVNSEYIQSGTSYNYTVNGNINIEYRNMATGRSSMINIIEL